MISRYSRRPQAHKLQIRGLSPSSLGHHHHHHHHHHPPPPPPPPEAAGDDSTLLLAPLQALHHTPPTWNSSDTPCRSGCPSVTAGDASRSWSGIQSYTGTGASTERSSVFSWGYDEFDKAASHQVQLMFEEIDEELYEGKGVQLRTLQEECQQWATRFPHLRILGKQLLCSTDEGFQWFSTSSHGPVAVSPLHNKTSSSELCVQGHRAVLSQPALKPSHQSEPALTSTGEEFSKVIEAEGLMEEYLAFDSRDLDEEVEGECVSRRRCSLPPMSPYRCRREAVLELLFDDVWQELIGWMEELIRRLWEGNVSDEEKNSVALSPAQPPSHSPFVLLSSLPPAPARPAPTRPPHAFSTLPPQSTKSRGSKHKSRRKSKMQRKPSTSSRVPGGSSAPHHNLNDLITIQGIPLQQRTVGVLDQTASDGEERASHYPSCSLNPSSKPRPRRALEQSSSSLPRPSQSARRRALPPRTLAPLTPVLTQSGVTAAMDEVIRGTRLATAGLSSSPMTLSRNTLLPPISTADTEHTRSGHHTRVSQHHRSPSSRAHSAVVEETGSLLPRDRLHPHDVFSRPNTTHTYRSDTPHRRSFTVLDSSVQPRPARVSVGTDCLGIGITGVSLGISSSAFLDSFSHHPLGHSPIEDEEESDAQAPPPAPLLPPPAPPRSHTRGLMNRSGRPGL